MQPAARDVKFCGLGWQIVNCIFKNLISKKRSLIENFEDIGVNVALKELIFNKKLFTSYLDEHSDQLLLRSLFVRRKNITNSNWPSEFSKGLRLARGAKKFAHPRYR